MKRVVEFRGKKRTTLQPKNLDVFNESEKEWVYGSFSNGIDGKGAYIMPYCYTAGLIAINEDVDEDGEDVIEYGTDLFLGGWIQVIPDSVGEFAGCHDKNSNKIFEGDILKDALGNSVFYVKFERGAFRGIYPNQNHSTYCLSGWVDPNPHLEIIGNVIDNPELLNK